MHQFRRKADANFSDQNSSSVSELTTGMSAISISASSALATFSTSHPSTSKLPHVTVAPVHGGGGSLAVAAVQGNGIWTYDVSLFWLGGVDLDSRSVEERI